jgi:hypothetical protein
MAEQITVKIKQLSGEVFNYKANPNVSIINLPNRLKKFIDANIRIKSQNWSDDRQVARNY